MTFVPACRTVFPLLSLVTMCASGATAHAQAANLPSDTIVRLAVDPGRYSGRPWVMLHEEQQYRIEADGRYVVRTRRVQQVLDANAARALSEHAIGYARSHQSLEIDWVRVLKTSGEVVSEKAAQEQEGDVPAAMNNPIYQDRRIRRLSLGGVTAGTIVDLAWTIEEKAPPRSGDFLVGWGFSQPYPTVHTRFVVDVPATMSPRLLEVNLPFTRVDEVRENRRVISWERQNWMPLRPERFAADSSDHVASVTVTAPTSWTDIGKWYDGLARERYSLNAAVAKRVDSVVAASGARSRIDTVRALHKWVAQDIRYVSIPLGMGAYQPREPLDVITTGFGDCKDKATLFVGALRRYRIPADPVLVSLEGRANSRSPSIHQFNHAIAVVGEGASRVYTDLTADVVSYGRIPMSYQGSFAVIVKRDGTTEEVRLPLLPTDSVSSTVRMQVVLDTTGTLRGTVTEEARGDASYSLRSAFMSPIDSTRRDQMQRGLAQRMFPSGGVVDSFAAFDGRDLAAPARLSYTVKADGLLRAVGSNKVLAVPPFIRGNATGYGNIARELEAQPARQMPIDASRILGNLVTITEVRITLPAGWSAELPANVLATSFFGSYESTWTQRGSEITLVRRIQGQRGIHPPQRITEVITWMKSVGADNYEFLVLRDGR